MWPKITFLIAYALLASNAVFGSLIKDSAEAYSIVVETHHKMNNMYFYAVIMLWPASLFMLGKVRQGGQLRPALSKSVAFTLYCINTVCLLFLVIHFAPESDTIFTFILSVFGRMFG